LRHRYYRTWRCALWLFVGENKALGEHPYDLGGGSISCTGDLLIDGGLAHVSSRWNSAIFWVKNGKDA